MTKSIDWIKNHIIDTDIDHVCERGLELVIQYDSSGPLIPFDIKPYLTQVFTYEEYMPYVRDLLDDFGLTNVPVQATLSMSLDQPERKHLMSMCNDISQSLDPELIELAEYLGIGEIENKQDVCLRLYQLILMINTLYEHD